MLASNVSKGSRNPVAYPSDLDFRGSGKFAGQLSEGKPGRAPRPALLPVPRTRGHLSSDLHEPGVDTGCLLVCGGLRPRRGSALSDGVSSSRLLVMSQWDRAGGEAGVW